jgi:hypothetical protein
MGRWAGTVRSSGPPESASTRTPASSGSQSVTGSARVNRPSSTNAIAAATVTGLLIEAMRKIVSRCIGSLAATSRWPSSPTCSTLPPCHTRVTAPASSPASITS